MLPQNTARRVLTTGIRRQNPLSCIRDGAGCKPSWTAGAPKRASPLTPNQGHRSRAAQLRGTIDVIHDAAGTSSRCEMDVAPNLEGQGVLGVVIQHPLLEG